MSDQPSATVAAAYDRGRPAYPVDAVTWLLGAPAHPLQVLELGAGTGKLTRTLVDLGHEVHATDPDGVALEVLRAAHPLVRASRAGAEELPLPDQSVDVVVVGDALDLFDLERALPEAQRVLRPGGHLAVVWNLPDTRIPWVRRLGALLEDEDGRGARDGRALEDTGLFGWVEDAAFKHRHPIHRESVLDLVRSQPHLVARGEDALDAKLEQVLAFYDDYGRGMDGMVVPLVARCFRARVTEKVAEKAAEKAPEPDAEPTGQPTGQAAGQAPLAPGVAPASPAETTDLPMLVTTGSIPRIEVEVAKAPQPVLDDDTAMLLIDFR